MNRFKSLKTKLIVLTTAIIFLTAILSLTIGIVASYLSLTQNVKSDLSSIGQTVEVAISNSLNNIKLSVKSIASSDIIGNAGSTQSALMSMLERQRQELGYESLSVVDAKGTIISTDKELNGKNIASQEYFKKAVAGETYISATAYDINERLCVIACTPVTNDNGYTGVVMAVLSPQTYSEIVKNIVVGKTGNVFVLDKEGTVIANVRPELVESRTNMIEKGKTDPAYQTVAVVHKHMAEGKSGVEIYAYDTGDRICYYEPIQGTDGWSYGVVAPISEMTSTIWYTIVGLGASALLCIAVGVVLSMLAAKSIANPITLVCRRLELLSEGDLQTDIVKVRAKDETGILASSLDKTICSLRGYIASITHTLQELSEGNMCAEVEGNFAGDFAPIKDSMVTITASLNAVLSDISEAAGQVSSGSEQVANGSQALAQGAMEQASAIEELSATIGEISENVNDNAQHAANASENVNDVRTEIEISNRHMEDMVAAMQQISESSGQIGKIIKTIEDIAFQTNILALNAAVEAARAGAAGKGFAVVADEVRNLASKSAEAAQNTTALIENSIRQVENGTKIVDETAKSLLRVVESAQVVTDTVVKISTASQHQAESIGQVTQGVEQISNVVQTNSATAEESAAASEELSSQAQTMKELVGRFKLGRQTDQNRRTETGPITFETDLF